MIIFLVFLLFFASIFSFFLQITGNFCDTAGNEYRTGTLNFFGNIGLLSSIPSEEELDNEYIDASGGFVREQLWYDCSNFYDDGYQYRPDGGEWTNFTDYRYYYIGTDLCVECNEWVKVRPILEDQGFFYTITYAPLWKEKICLDRYVYPKEYSELTWLGKQKCTKTESLTTCSIPQGYYYDGNNNVFVCNDELCTNTNETTSTVGKAWNLKLKEQGATIRPPSPHGDRDYRNALRVECDEGDLDPKLRVFGVNPFDYRLWLFIILLSALVWLVFKIKRR
jgi:hypothetical protein